MAKQSSNPKIVTKKHIARLERERRQITIIRWISIGAILVVALLLGYGYLKVNVLAAREPVAEVNGEQITTADWQERVRFQRVSLYNQLSTLAFYQQFGMDVSQQQNQIMSTLQLPELVGQQVLDQMVDEALIRQEAAKRGITVSSEEVDEKVQEAFNFFPNGTATPTVTPTEFVVEYPTLSSQQLTLYPSTLTPTAVMTSTPAPTSTPDRSATATATSTVAPPTPTFVPQSPTATSTPFTLEGFEKEYDESLTTFKGYEISEKTLRSVYEMDLLRSKLKEELAKDLARTDTQVLVRHILVTDEATAQLVYDQLKAGQDFAKLAADFSTDPGSAANGGYYDWAPASNYVAEFRDATLTQEIGEIGQPVQTEYGYHVIQVIGREELPTTDTQFEQKKESVFEEWLTTARESADIQKFDIWQDRVPTGPVLQ
jgi:parvulin-like peptidyl-prolyl isomerase